MDNLMDLSGSVTHVLELFRYAINGILFHRGVYPAEDFYIEKRFGLDLTLIVVSSVEDYIEQTLHRLREWLLNDQIKQMVVVLLDADDGHVIERWVFEPKVTTTTSGTQMDRELSAVMKDIVTPTFLPPLEKPTVFDVLVYTRDTAEIPDGWDSTHSYAVEDGEYDTMKGLIAPNHHVGMSVVYRDED